MGTVAGVKVSKKLAKQSKARSKGASSHLVGTTTSPIKPDPQTAPVAEPKVAPITEPKATEVIKPAIHKSTKVHKSVAAKPMKKMRMRRLHVMP